MFVIMTAAPVICICTCGRKAGQAAQQEAAVLLSLVGFHVTLWRHWEASCGGELVGRRFLFLNPTGEFCAATKLTNLQTPVGGAPESPKDERDRRNSSQWSQLK